MNVKGIEKIPLIGQTPSGWLGKVLENFPYFVADHASNERKAAATAMDFVVRYPDQRELVRFAGKVAEEEISHFRQVFQKMVEYGYPLRADEKDPYVGGLHRAIRKGSDERLLDRLLVCALVEARGLERFEILADKHPSQEWQSFYQELMSSELGHALGFFKEAVRLFSMDQVEERLTFLLELEGELCQSTPLTGRFH